MLLEISKNDTSIRIEMHVEQPLIKVDFKGFIMNLIRMKQSIAETTSAAIRARLSMPLNLFHHLSFFP